MLKKYYNDYNKSKFDLYKRLICQRKPGYLAATLGVTLSRGVSLGIFDTCQ